MKLRALLALFLTAVASLVALVAPTAASAAPVAYPAAVCSTLSVSTSSPSLGQTISVKGANFVPGSQVKLELVSRNSSRTIASTLTVRAGSDGSFTTSFTMPSSTINQGNYLLVAVSGYETGGSCPADPSVPLALGAAGAGAHSPSSGTGAAGGSGGTAFTGVDIALLVALAVALVVVGSVLVARNRRRTTTGV